MILAGLSYYYFKRRRFKTTELNIKLGSIGLVVLKPRKEDLDIAHKIWVELVTRKAAIPIDPEHDVIHEVYDSWYQLFGRIRLLIADIPAELIHDHESTRVLVDLATRTLNDGIRPHLTRWQARYRHWYAIERESKPYLTPQELQRTFPQYEELMKNMVQVNNLLKEYADELKKLL